MRWGTITGTSPLRVRLDGDTNELPTTPDTLIDGLEVNDRVRCEISGRVIIIGRAGGTHIIDLVYPVGSIYISVNPTNPGTIFGGTWAAWGAGRVPVGVDAGQTEFNTVEKTGGAKTHTLTIAEMPAHTHGLNKKLGGSYVSNNSDVARGDETPSDSAGQTDSRGGGDPHNNLQPYITAHFWKRTA